MLALAFSLQGEVGGKAGAIRRDHRRARANYGKYADVQWQAGRLGDTAEPLLFSLKYLHIGRKPPDIVGKDAAGVEFKLSDFRGKVVVLDFWVDWCPYCREMYPVERQLAERWKDKPFAIVGVNGDDPKRLQELVKEKTITWRNWSDGHEGPIQQNLAVASFPRYTCSIRRA